MNRLPPHALPVAVTLALLLAAGLAAIALCGRNIAMAEDWSMVPAMTGHEENLLAWLWSQNNEHRLPVQRLIYLLLLRATEDFRAGMIFSQVLLAGLAAVLAWTAATVRGGAARWSDLLFPLAVLHLGHWENLVWGWQLQFVWSVALEGLLLAIVVARPGPLSFRAGSLAAAILLLLPISGANGILVAAVMTPWLALQGLGRLRSERARAERRFGSLLLGASLLSLGLIALYFTGYQRPSWSPPPPTLEQFLRLGGLYYAYALGPAARWMQVPALAVVVVVMGLGGLCAARTLLLRDNEERLRAVGLTLFIGAGVLLGMAIAWGRGAIPHSIADRYALLSALPLLAAVYALDLYAPPRLAKGLATGLALLLIALLPYNVRAGFEWRDWYVEGMRRLETDIAAGVAIPELARRHHVFLNWPEERLRAAMAMLHEAGIGPFARRPLGMPQPGRD